MLDFRAVLARFWACAYEPSKPLIAVIRRPVIFIVAIYVVDGVLGLISRWIDKRKRLARHDFLPTARKRSKYFYSGLTAALPRLCGALNGNEPAEQEKAATAKRAAVGLKEPQESCLYRVSGADASKIDGSATGTAHGE